MKLRTIKNMAAIFCVNHILAGTRFFEIKRKLLCSAGYEIGEGTKVVAPIQCTGKLVVGKNCWVGKEFGVYGNGTVTIGDCCDIAPQVSFHTGGHEIGTAERRAGKGIISNIRVGNGVWIGARSTFLREISVGNGTMIAACACVVKDVPDNVMVAGVPARVIREFVDEAASAAQE